MANQILEELRRELPAIIFREAVPRLVPGLNARTLANEDCAGIGPGKRMRIGRKIAYSREAFIEWLVAKQRKV